jgi:hypothetical protein
MKSCRIENPGDQSKMECYSAGDSRGSVDCALSMEVDGLLGYNSPQNFGGAQAELWHGADGHPLNKGYPVNARTSLVGRDF